MDDQTRGPFSYEQRETAPPWSVGWLPTSTEMADQLGDHTVSRPRETHGDQGRDDQQKKKLFVGMAPKSAYEEDYRAVFEPFGTPIDIYVIRDRNGFSKGCAFVKYDSVKSASDAIEALHDKHIMPGGFRTLVVTVADERRGPHTATTGSTTTRCDTGGSADCNSISVSGPPSFMGSDNGGIISSLGNLMVSNRSTAAATQTGAAAFAPTVAPGVGLSLSGMSQILCRGNPPQGTYVYYPYVPSSPGEQDTTIPAGPVGIGTKPHHAFSVGSPAAGSIGRREVGSHAIQEDVYAGDRTARRFGTGGHGGPEERGRRWAKQSVGPTGANLFVYYLPGSLTDADLATAFAPFGEVLSAKVYYDRETGESKGFGFVSYSTPNEAEAAISGMNGFFIGQKRLKVVRKRGQQTDRYRDSNRSDSVWASDPGDAIGDGTRFFARPDSGDSGNGGTRAFVGGRMNSGNDTGLANGEVIGHRILLGAESQSGQDFFSPESLLGPSMSRFL